MVYTGTVQTSATYMMFTCINKIHMSCFCYFSRYCLFLDYKLAYITENVKHNCRDMCLLNDSTIDTTQAGSAVIVKVLKIYGHKIFILHVNTIKK